MDVFHSDRGIPLGICSYWVYKNVLQIMMSTSVDYCRALVFFFPLLVDNHHCLIVKQQNISTVLLTSWNIIKLEDFFHSVPTSLGLVPFPTFPSISMISLSFNNIITLQALIKK
jgi:hypothetical protein